MREGSLALRQGLLQAGVGALRRQAQARHKLMRQSETKVETGKKRFRAFQIDESSSASPALSQARSAPSCGDRALLVSGVVRHVLSASVCCGECERHATAPTDLVVFHRLHRSYIVVHADVRHLGGLLACGAVLVLLHLCCAARRGMRTGKSLNHARPLFLHSPTAWHTYCRRCVRT